MTQSNPKKKLKPFDNTLMDDLCMYDKMPYVSNYDLCNSSTVTIQSGNLLKSYRVKELEPYIIKPDETRFQYHSSESLQSQKNSSCEEVITDSEELSKEQLDSLLKDKEALSAS